MPEQPLISVRGEAVVKVEPEIARLEVSVVSRDADRAAALHLLEERVEKVTKILASTIQNNTASTLTGTVSEVSVCSAAKLVVMVR